MEKRKWKLIRTWTFTSAATAAALPVGLDAAALKNWICNARHLSSELSQNPEYP